MSKDITRDLKRPQLVQKADFHSFSGLSLLDMVHTSLSEIWKDISEVQN